MLPVSIILVLGETAPPDAPPADGPTVPQRSLAAQPGEGGWAGRVIGAKYVVEGVIGRGGMGLVLRARHLRLDELVAIKVLHRSLSSDPTMAARLLREARAALRIQSDHAVRVMDIDLLEDGAPYLVLEYLEGTDLASFQRARGAPMSAEQASAIADHACRGLAEAHALGVVHRDVKPANLFLVTRPDGRRLVKLLDFGISRLTLGRDAPVTRPGDIVGSPRYMSPQQVLGGDVDGRSDIWSLGVVLYELLSGKSPFGGDNFARTIQSVCRDTPTPLASLRPDLPPGLSAAVMRCLEKEPEARFPDANALREALAPFGPVSGRPGTQAALPDISAVLDAPPPALGRDSTAGQGTSAVAGQGTSAAAGQGTSGQPISPLDAASAADPTTLVHVSATGVTRRRPLVPMALAGLAVGVAVGVGVLTWSNTAPPPPAGLGAAPSDRASAAALRPMDLPATPASAAPAPVAPGASDLPTAAPTITAPSASPSLQVLPRAPSDSEPSLEPRPTAKPVASAAKPRVVADPFGQQRK